VLCSQTQFGALASIDTLQRTTPSGMLTVAYFNKYYCIAIKHDQIEFAASAAPVLFKQTQAMLLQMLTGQSFGLRPAEPDVGIH
jgi:hypothetical protein